MILGITGKSGTGKHTAADFLKQKGWTVLDADKIAHHLYRPYTHVWKAVIKHFGEGILGKKDIIDRQKLGEIVFNPNKQEELKELNKIVHPEIKRYLKNEIHYLRRKERNAAVIAALWKEMGLIELCDKVLSISANEDLAFERVKKRDGISEEAYGARTKNQLPLETPDIEVINEEDRQSFYKLLNQSLAL